MARTFGAAGAVVAVLIWVYYSAQIVLFGAEFIKVFATQTTTNFRWLQLPALDQPPAQDSVQRAAIHDPLEQLLAQMTGETLATREVRITSSPKTRGWTAAQVELRVKADAQRT